MRLFYLLIIIILVCNSCKETPDKHDVEAVFVNNDSLVSLVDYAEGFDIYKINGIYQLVVYHPELSSVILGKYYVSSPEITNEYYEHKNFFSSPVDSIALFSATQINALAKLDLLNKIVGVSEANYIKNRFVKERIKAGKIKELAGSGDFYVETTLMLNPNVIFYSPYKVIQTHPLEVTGIPLIPFYDYHETDPLGRAEWIKFSAIFFGKYSAADSIFQEIVKSYQSFKKIAENESDRPTVFSDKYFNGQWYVPGGQSYIAKVMTDAGADYLWKNDPHKASFPLDYEVVYDKAYDADYWRIVGSYGDTPSYDALQAENNLYQHFRAFKNKKVIWCDAEETAYFEQSPLEPHLVLADLIKAFHPKLLPNHQPKYYKLLKE